MYEYYSEDNKSIDENKQDNKNDENYEFIKKYLENPIIKLTDFGNMNYICSFNNYWFLYTYQFLIQSPKLISVNNWVKLMISL